MAPNELTIKVSKLNKLCMAFFQYQNSRRYSDPTCNEKLYKVKRLMPLMNNFMLGPRAKDKAPKTK